MLLPHPALGLPLVSWDGDWHPSTWRPPSSPGEAPVPLAGAAEPGVGHFPCAGVWVPFSHKPPTCQAEVGSGQPGWWGPGKPVSLGQLSPLPWQAHPGHGASSPAWGSPGCCRQPLALPPKLTRAKVHLDPPAWGTPQAWLQLGAWPMMSPWEGSAHFRPCPRDSAGWGGPAGAGLQVSTLPPAWSSPCMGLGG